MFKLALFLAPTLTRGFKKINLEKQPSLPVSEKIGKNGFYIPIGNHLSKSDQDYIIKNLIRILDEHQ